MKLKSILKTTTSTIALTICFTNLPTAYAMEENGLEFDGKTRVLVNTEQGARYIDIPTNQVPQAIRDNQFRWDGTESDFNRLIAHDTNFLSTGLIALNLVKPHKMDTSQCYRLLSLDGGGQRAEVFLPTLIAIEMLTGKSIFELYDGIGGTSTGGITSLGLSYKNPITGQPMTALDMLKMYHHCSREIFRETAFQGVLGMFNATAGGLAKKAAQGTGIKHDHSGLEKLADMIVGKEKFQADKFLTDVFITTVNEGKGSVLEIFSTIDPNVKNAAIWQVLRCTSAAKTYFMPMVLEDGSVYVDGGHMSNHPAADVFNHIASHRNNVIGNMNITIHSLGTGDTTVQKSLETIKSEGVMSKTLGTIQDAFKAQELNANQAIASRIGEYENAKAMGADFSKSKIPYIESYLRSQTDPLAPALHEMDKPENTLALLEVGLMQLYKPETMSIFKALFANDLSDDALMIELGKVENSIRTQLNTININDTREISLLENICLFINSKEHGTINSEDTASAFFNGALGINVQSMETTDLANALLWTQKMLQMNEEHRLDTTVLQKMYSGVKYYANASTSHGMINSYVKNLQTTVLQRIAQIMRNENQNFDERQFIGDNLTSLCTTFFPMAKPGYFQSNQETVASEAFQNLFGSKLLPVEMMDNARYKSCLIVLLDQIISEVSNHYGNSYGAITGARNTFRSWVGLNEVVSSHTLLINKLNQLKEQVLASLNQ